MNDFILTISWIQSNAHTLLRVSTRANGVVSVRWPDCGISPYFRQSHCSYRCSALPHSHSLVTQSGQMAQFMWDDLVVVCLISDDIVHRCSWIHKFFCNTQLIYSSQICLNIASRGARSREPPGGTSLSALIQRYIGDKICLTLFGWRKSFQYIPNAWGRYRCAYEAFGM